MLGREWLKTKLNWTEISQAVETVKKGVDGCLDTYMYMYSYADQFKDQSLRVSDTKIL